ncbi:MAG: nucleotidyltransferase domain-containing protein [Nitriliruptor sp.]|nr:MAG: nucleotidyltransferase domain-containing protein [Nitriliruptor sp.]
MDDETALRRLRDRLADMEQLRLLVLHGSRASGTQHENSDWDLGYLATAPLDPGELHLQVTDALATEAVDLVDLDRASALLRFRAARDGKPVVARPQGAWTEFVLAATHFWCDAGPVIERAHDELLAELAP